MENFNSDIDKRRFPRIASNLPVQYKNLRNASNLPIGSLTSNISEGGICFRSNEFISLACRLVVEIALPTALKPVKAISKVAWIRRVPQSDQYELGNQFLDMTKEDKQVMSNFVNSALKTSI